jgi:hypothetical protein
MAAADGMALEMKQSKARSYLGKKVELVEMI